MTARLPTVSGDSGTWGTVLNEYLAVAHEADGSHKGHALAANSSAGATSITLLATPTTPIFVGQYIVIDAYTTQAEVRKVSTISAATVTLTSALEFAHATGDKVMAVTTPFLTTDVFGCTGNGSTDDHAGLQQGLNSACGSAGLWLDGGGVARTHIILQPLLALSSAKLRGIVIKAGGTFAPADTTNAMLMSMQGSVRAFTALASTNEFTTSSSHGIPANNTLVVFQGSSLPTGVIAGRNYYVQNRGTTTFQVAATSGGSVIDLTTNGSGTVFCEVLSMGKLYLEDVFINGNSVSGINGLFACLQQPSQFIKVRVDNCNTGVGMNIGGQQAVFYNIEIVTCEKGLVLGGAPIEAAQFMWFFGLNVEGTNHGIYVDAAGAACCLFDGIHMEGFGTNGIAINIDHSAIQMDFRNFQFSGTLATQTAVKVDTGSAQTSGYTLTMVRATGGAIPGMLMLNDVDRGVTIDTWGDVRNYLNFASASPLPTSQTYTDPSPFVVLRPNGGKLSFGSQVDTQSSLQTKPATSQTGDQVTARDTSGNRISGFNKAGVMFTERNTVPADADLVAGELTFWLDDTNGACKAMFKAKQADGTVRTGQVALS